MNMKVLISPYVNITRLSMKHQRLGKTQTNLKRYVTSIILREHEGSYLAICKHYKVVYETPEIMENSDKLKEVCYFNHSTGT